MKTVESSRAVDLEMFGDEEPKPKSDEPQICKEDFSVENQKITEHNEYAEHEEEREIEPIVESKPDHNEQSAENEPGQQSSLQTDKKLGIGMRKK